MSATSIVLSIPADHPAYAGHFPGQPILPGVVLLDAALSLLAAQQDRDAPTWQLKSAKFLSPVRPGEPLQLHYSTTSDGSLRFEIRCGERGVASGAVSFAPGTSA